MTASHLALAGVSLQFGGLVALDDVTLDLAPGTRAGLVGPNGAGKSSLVQVIAGLVPPTAGAVRLFGQAATDWPPHRRVRHGLGRTFQHARVFPRLTVTEHVALAGRHGRPGQRQPAPADLLAIAGLTSMADWPAARLDPLAAKVLDVVRAVAAGPCLLLLDEPFAGLDAARCRAVARLLAEVLPADTTVLLVEHRLDLLLAHVAELLVLRQGRLIARGPGQAILRDPEVIAAWLGKPHG